MKLVNKNKFSNDDLAAFRIFYQTLASSSGQVTKAQVDFYKMVLKGDADSRKAWTAAYIKDINILDPSIAILLASSATLSKEQIAIIAASAIAPRLPNMIDRLTEWVKSWFA